MSENTPTNPALEILSKQIQIQNQHVMQLIHLMSEMNPYTSGLIQGIGDSLIKSLEGTEKDIVLKSLHDRPMTPFKDLLPWREVTESLPAGTYDLSGVMGQFGYPDDWGSVSLSVRMESMDRKILSMRYTKNIEGLLIEAYIHPSESALTFEHMPLIRELLEQGVGYNKPE